MVAFAGRQRAVDREAPAAGETQFEFAFGGVGEPAEAARLGRPDRQRQHDIHAATIGAGTAAVDGAGKSAPRRARIGRARIIAAPMLRPARWIPFLAALLLMPLAELRAQGGTKPGTLTLAAAFDPQQAKPGDTVTLVLTATVTDGWHAYGTEETVNTPVALKPAKLKLGGLELAGELCR